jgi:hypothetical protein
MGNEIELHRYMVLRNTKDDVYNPPLICLEQIGFHSRNPPQFVSQAKFVNLRGMIVIKNINGDARLRRGGGQQKRVQTCCF